MDPVPIIYPLALLHCANMYVTSFVTGQCNDGQVSERHPTSQLSMRWWVLPPKNTEVQPKTGNFQARQKSYKPLMPQRQSGTNPHEQQRAHSKHQVVGEHTKWKMNLNDILTDWNLLWFFCLRCGRFSISERDGHFRYYPSQELLCRDASDLWRPRIRFKSVVGDPLPSAGLSHDSAWMFQSDWPQINRRQHRFQCQLFWRTKTGQGWNSRLLCCPDVAA